MCGKRDCQEKRRRRTNVLDAGGAGKSGGEFNEGGRDGQGYYIVTTE